jgi:predicted transposase YdaD
MTLKTLEITRVEACCHLYTDANLQLYLYEHQASVNPNMPLRDLFYVSEVLQNIMKDVDLYSSGLKRFPTPRFVVFYNGVEEKPEHWEICLSEAFEQSTESPKLELVVTVININLGKNKELMEACKVLHDYAVFIQKIRDYTKMMTLEEAAERTIDECVKEDVLVDFLKKHRAEAKNMCRCLYEYDEERHIREERKIAREDGWREGWNDGAQAGRREGRRDGERYKLAVLVLKKIRKNYTIPEIADMLEEDEDVIRRICDVAKEYAPDYDAEKIIKYL